VCQRELHRRQRRAKDMKNISAISYVKESKVEKGKRLTVQNRDGRRWVWIFTCQGWR
jgi:hypothetical protein